MAELYVTTRYGEIYAIVPKCPGPPWSESAYREHHFTTPVYSGHLWWKKYWLYCLCGDRRPTFKRGEAISETVVEAGNKLMEKGHLNAWMSLAVMTK